MFTCVVETGRELLHEREREEQKSWQGGVTQVITGWQEARGSEASMIGATVPHLDRTAVLALKIKACSCGIQKCSAKIACRQ